MAARLRVVRLLVKRHLGGAGRDDTERGQAGARGPVAEVRTGPDEAFHEGAGVTVAPPCRHEDRFRRIAGIAGVHPEATGLFRGERLPEGLGADELLAAGVEIEQAPK